MSIKTPNCNKIIVFMALIFFMTVAADAEEPDIVRISLKENDSLRSMASTYLGDPNEWKVILYYNGFAGPADVNADTTIAIPVKLYKETAKRILEAGELTRRANMEGAGILAKDIIENSIRLQNDAVALKNKGKLRQARKVAAEAVEYSQKALSVTKKKKIRSISALLSKKHGSIQNRMPPQPLWVDTMINQELAEKEHVRSLSKSRGQLLFIDGSRMNLNENSLAVIGMMKENVVDKSYKTSVTVLEGDILVQLASLTPIPFPQQFTPLHDAEFYLRHTIFLFFQANNTDQQALTGSHPFLPQYIFHDPPSWHGRSGQ